MSESRDFAAKRFANPREAVKWLEERYDEQRALFPKLAIVASKAVYVHRNLPAAMKMTVEA